MDSLDVVSRPFAAFFEEAIAPSWVTDTIARPSAHLVGTVRLPLDFSSTEALDRCVECLHPQAACRCD